MLSGIPVSFLDGETIFVQGEAAADLFIVRSGGVRITRWSEEAGEEVLAELGPGDFFGEMAVFDPGPRSATATAIGPTDLDAIDRSTFLESMDDADVQAILAEMARRMRGSRES